MTDYFVIMRNCRLGKMIDAAWYLILQKPVTSFHDNITNREN